ncbi:MAG: hypothetical protein ACXIUM_14630 [Wenzhouxiangella sp.]
MDYITVKLALVVVGLIGFGIWQLRDINRSLAESAEEDTVIPGATSDASEANDESPKQRS